MLTAALLDVAETHLELGQPLPKPNPLATDREMDSRNRSICTLAQAATLTKYRRERSLREAKGLAEALRGTVVSRCARSSHSVWVNPANGHQSAIPRHREINDYTARVICRQLGVAEP